MGESELVVAKDPAFRVFRIRCMYPVTLHPMDTHIVMELYLMLFVLVRPLMCVCV